jgi:hypothetical protein
MINHPNTAIARAEDVLAEARNCINCIFLAAANLGGEETGAIQHVASIASAKIDEAIAMLDEYRNGEAPSHFDGLESFERKRLSH